MEPKISPNPLEKAQAYRPCFKKWVPKYCGGKVVICPAQKNLEADNEGEKLNLKVSKAKIASTLPIQWTKVDANSNFKETQIAIFSSAEDHFADRIEGEKYEYFKKLQGEI